MAEGMFGSPIGVSAFNKDWREQVKTAIDAEEALGRIAMQPSEIALREAHTRLYGAQADEKIAEAEAARRAGALAREAMQGQGAQGVPGGAQGGQPTLDQLAGHLGTVASRLAGEGYINKATDIAKVSSTLLSQASTRDAALVKAQLDGLKIFRDRAELNAQFFGHTTDDASLQQANRSFEFQTGQPSPYRDTPWTPEFVENLNQSALSTKERYDLEEKVLTREATEKYRGGRLKQHDLLNEIRERAEKRRRDREDRLAKSGGRLPAAEPKQAEIDMVKSLILRDFPFMATLGAGTSAAPLYAAMKGAAFTIVAEARALMRADPTHTLDLPRAINQAYSNAVKAGDIVVDPGNFMGFGKKFEFVGGGRSIETALPPQPDRAKRKSGRYYILPNGAVGIWRGGSDPKKVWEAASPRSGGDNREFPTIVREPVEAEVD